MVGKSEGRFPNRRDQGTPAWTGQGRTEDHAKRNGDRRAQHHQEQEGTEQDFHNVIVHCLCSRL